ncbi:Homeobox-DDT domain protein RLT2 [Camellia lanceoleosa]|uniref:Homeobox-DDT domain protein RLT2 n=1 Tax=Camellia lanceoleosa TaxID=1840588 RepID=A0ACC0GEF1_9ERIC|nr:Homeobox-DDT domain protein RLT2 [Camellia lanceoleosa]
MGWRYRAGLFLIAAVVIIWVTSAEVTQERLSAVVALIGIANEGNSIRIILEACLEAANALKKQMCTEVQLDKCRMKEEYVMKIQYPSYISDKTEPNVQISSVEGRQSPLPTVDDKNNLVSTNPVEQKEHLHDAQNDPNYPIHMPSKRNPQIQEVSTCTDNLSLLQPGYAAERSWSQLKSYIGHEAEEMYVYKSLPLGQDRRRNRYWQFITSSSRNDPGSGRIFVELRHGCWRLIDFEEGLDYFASKFHANSTIELLIKGARCGIYGANCMKWIISMQLMMDFLAVGEELMPHRDFSNIGNNSDSIRGNKKNNWDKTFLSRQLRNLEKAFGGDVRVCDRTALILDIFNQRAATHEAALQVALAQMESVTSTYKNVESP